MGLTPTNGVPFNFNQLAPNSGPRPASGHHFPITNPNFALVSNDISDTGEKISQWIVRTSYEFARWRNKEEQESFAHMLMFGAKTNVRAYRDRTDGITPLSEQGHMRRWDARRSKGEGIPESLFSTKRFKNVESAHGYEGHYNPSQRNGQVVGYTIPQLNWQLANMAKHHKGPYQTITDITDTFFYMGVCEDGAIYSSDNGLSADVRAVVRQHKVDTQNIWGKALRMWDTCYIAFVPVPLATIAARSYVCGPEGFTKTVVFSGVNDKDSTAQQFMWQAYPMRSDTGSPPPIEMVMSSVTLKERFVDANGKLHTRTIEPVGDFIAAGSVGNTPRDIHSMDSMDANTLSSRVTAIRAQGAIELHVTTQPC